ncbi:TPA: site-specific DNA-methyltransferase [Legionella pneumophila]|uniref:site-specific DNA-methyltransferase n=1 Tax=Legionella pneumophila TaxID=446 RepID=UPI0018D2D00D|nr:site-specific DNA-methyltransferase [Legionella pneumophila]MDI9851324.1 site-specific DNA-methyltransferase [Legionella pneumophila]MDW8855277.1 site-specific DNA-methyltransferase [Legionella pneumophila]MDW8922552.1 site-specific DNA-methyltransferase [Legionella pneumophila]MDW8928763.1 site-specific DNA-methyltransferase [Legionella pneumophila]MDW8969667.1 site-specific DNA-methyltransferase [Legionella pneumophila]
MHERIDPYTIIQAIKSNSDNHVQISLFDQHDTPLREAIEFYKHKSGWTNRLIAGDSLLVMNSLLEKEGMANQIQMIYIDPPYGITYGSNFQPFINKTTVKDKNDSDLSAEPETLKAFRDTWELGIHSYLTYMRDRLLLAKELLHESGSCFVQISDENVHHLRELMDEVFGPKNFVGQISVTKSGALSKRLLPRRNDYILWYAKDIDKIKYRKLFLESSYPQKSHQYDMILLEDGTIRNATEHEKFSGKLPSGAEAFRYVTLTKPGPGSRYEYTYKGKKYNSGTRWWGFNPDGLKELEKQNRLAIQGNSLVGIRYFNDFAATELDNVWTDTATGSGMDKIYVVQTNNKIIQRCMLMTSDPGDLVLDPTCGSGTTAVVAEQWGRRWITCDTSRVAITLAKQRIMTSKFDYYELAHIQEGISSGFQYKTIPHITLGSIVKKEQGAHEVLYDQPKIDRTKVRVAGPFTYEAVPAPTIQPLDEVNSLPATDRSITRSGETLKQYEWQDELLKTGIRGKSGQRINFSRIEPLSGMRYLNAEGETQEESAQRVVISFGPQHAPLEQRQVEMAIEEAQSLVPKPKIIVFAAFQFDPEASKDIDETNWPGVTLLKVQMNADLYTEDLKKKRSSNDSFWLVGQPDIELKKVDDSLWQIHVLGFDYYNTATGALDSGGADKIAMWMLDTDYDGRSLYPKQVFFPFFNEKIGWKKFAKNLKAEVDQEKIKTYSGTISSPFSPGQYNRIAVKIIDDRGIESLKIINIS